MAISKEIGLDCKAYYNTATNASPTWVEITRVKDLDLELGSKAAGALTSRSSNFEKFASGLRTLSVNFGYDFIGGTDTVYLALNAAWLAGTVTQYAFFDGAIATAGRQGLRMYGVITSLNMSQPLEDGLTVDVTIRPAVFDESGIIEPTWPVTS